MNHPPETLYVRHSGVLPAAPVSSTRRRGFPVLALILALCAAGWFSIGGWLLAVDSHSWDLIVPSMLLGSGSYVVLARWAYQDWRNPVPRNLDTVRKV